MQESCKFGLYNDGVDTNEGERNDGETKATCDDKRIKRSPKRNEGKFCRRISGKPKELLLRLKDTLEGEDRRIMENILKTFGEKEDGK